MRLRSLMALIFLSFTALGLTGCDSSSDETSFVVTTPPAAVNTGSLTFNFVTAQQAFTVDADTDRLRFEFFESNNALGDPFRTVNTEFQASVTISDLPISTRSVKITGFDENGIPLFFIVQSVNVVGGENTVVEGFTPPTAITLQSLELVSAGSVDGVPLDEVNLEVNGTGQVYLNATYSDGSEIIVGNAATYSNDPNDADSASVLEVGEFGQLRGLAPGETNLIVEFGGQTLTIPVSVQDALSVTFSDIEIVNGDPIDIPTGTSAQISVNGTRASDGFVFGISPTNENLQYSLIGDVGISITDDGVLVVAPNTAGASDATITVSYTNSNGTIVTDQAQVIVSGDAGVSSINSTVTRSNLFTDVPAFGSQITISESLTDGTTRTGAPGDYTFEVDDPNVATVDQATGIITPVGPGVATITITNDDNPTVTDEVIVTVEDAGVTSVSISPTSPAIPAGQSREFTLLATLSNQAQTQIDVTELAGFALTGPGASVFGLNDNVVSVPGGTTPGTQAVITGSFDPDGTGGTAPRTAQTTITSQ